MVGSHITSVQSIVSVGSKSTNIQFSELGNPPPVLVVEEDLATSGVRTPATERLTQLWKMVHS